MNRSAITVAPLASAGRITSPTSCARAAAYSSASAQGRICAVGSSSSSRIRSPTAVPPGSRTATTSPPSARSASASRAAWVVFPHPSRPSNEMNIPTMVVGATAPEAAVRPCYPPGAMGKTLIIAEKPSVGQDYAKALQERFGKHEGYLESDEHIVSWAIGHLVELAEPEDYDEALKRWSIKTLPVLPEKFKLKPESRGKKQYDVLRKLLKRDDVDDIVNGCDAGREGELIFQYIMDVAKTSKPVQRLWVSSMTKDAIGEGF